MLLYALPQLLLAFANCQIDPVCTDFGQGTECGRACQATELTCRENCASDAECEFRCLKTLSSCIAACPCFDDCPSGCDGCDSQYCQCNEPLENEDYVFCQRAAEAQYNRCVYQCSIGDAMCLSECNRDYTRDHSYCPCMDQCPAGCPCETDSLEYQCPDRTANTTTAIIHETKFALLAFPSGRNEQMQLTYDEDANPGVNGGVSLIFRNQFLMYSKNDVFELVNCNMKKIGTTEFKVAQGTVARGQIVVLDADALAKQTYRSTDPLFSAYIEVANHAYTHNFAPMAASAAAHWQNNKTELLDLDTWQWSEGAEHPANSLSFEQMKGELVYLYPHFYLIGGCGSQAVDENSISEISSYDEFENTWKQIGNLRRPRTDFSAVVYGYSIMIYGGYSTVDDVYDDRLSSEKCVISGDTVDCTSQAPNTDYILRPFLFSVEDDFCIESVL